jgi:lipoprotein-anchoring transpeptidase ErfK/SrfK
MKTRGKNTNALAQQRLALTYLSHHSKKVQKAHHTVKHLMVGSALVLAFAIFTWVGGNIFGARFSLQNKTFSAHTSDEQMLQAVQDKARTYRLTLIQPDGKRHLYSLQDMGMQVRAEDSVATARQEQHSPSGRLRWWKPVQLKVVIDTNQAAFAAFVAQHATIAVAPAQDASLALVDGVPQLTDGVNGKQYGIEHAERTITQAASGLQTAPLQMHLVVKQPTVTAKSLHTAKTKLETILNRSIDIAIDAEHVKPDAKEIADWIVLTPDAKTKDVTMSVDANKVRNYINSVAGQHNRPPRAQINLSDGGTIPGSNGITITNKDDAVANVTGHLLENKELTVSLPVTRTPYKSVNTSGSGRWLEVDLTNKRMYAYQDNSLVRTFLISAGAPKTPTVTGTYSIYSKMTKKTMSGPNADGTRYVQPNVPWVNFFYKDYAIHGNYWRPNSYFGNINSSHGCVGVTPSEGAWIYKWAAVGTTVVIHT